MEEKNFRQWAVVELFGHQQIAGLVSEQTIAGQGFVRVDVPTCGDQEAFTRLFGTGAIYSIIPTTEEIATAFARRNISRPINPWQLALPEPDKEDEGQDDEDDRELDEDVRDVGKVDPELGW
jgi:hypothetical protein